MDPITVLGVIGGAGQVAGQLAVAVLAIETVLRKFQGAPSSIIRLTSGLRLLGEELKQIQTWLDRNTIASSELRVNLDKALQDCAEGIADMNQHVQKLLPSPKTSDDVSNANRTTDASFKWTKKALYIWKEPAIRESENYVQQQLQAIPRIINLIKP